MGRAQVGTYQQTVTLLWLQQGEHEGTCPIVSVGMCLRGYPSMSLSLYVVPTICKPLTGQPISMYVKHPHVLGLQLADSSDTALNMPIDMLIGSDYYWQLVTGSICRGTSGPIAVHTKLGWVPIWPIRSRRSYSMFHEFECCPECYPCSPF